MKNNNKISLRRVNFSDIEFLWYLRNQKDTYRYFKNNRPVSWKSHINWMLPIVLGQSSREIFIIQKSEKPVGQIRFDYNTCDIGISILREFRGEGIAGRALVVAIKKAKQEKKAKELIAEINRKNPPSIKLFEKAGFKLKSKKGNWLKYFLKIKK